MVMLNQVGYNINQEKVAVVQWPGKYEVRNEQGEVVLHTSTKAGLQDPLTGETLYTVDFTRVNTPGVYRLVCEYGDTSCNFKIGEDVYKDVHNAMIKALYFQRCGCALEEKHAGKFKHAACHMEDVALWTDKGKKFECPGGWHDAGDYGRYISPAAVTIGHLLYAYEKYPAAFAEELNIPESGNGVADVLNECRYELEWMLKMQLEDGSVYHKLTAQYHAPFVMPQEDKDTFYAYEVSSMAVADFCACMALSARVYRDVDAAFADKLAEAAKKAWAWLAVNPQKVLFQNPEDSNTGDYGDTTDRDERLWAAVEMFYLTLAEEKCGVVDGQNNCGEAAYGANSKVPGNENTTDTGNCCTPEVCKAQIKALLQDEEILYDFGWTDVSGFALLAILKDESRALGEEIYETCAAIVKQEAQRLLALCKENAFAIGMDENDFVWGSNMVITNRGILWSLAYELTGDESYVTAIQNHLDYLLGKNITGYSYVTGFGEKAYRNPHSRPCAADGIDEPIPGWVSGGANSKPCDPDALAVIPEGSAPMKCFADVTGSYSTNEITIYWNSSAVYVTAFLRR